MIRVVLYCNISLVPLVYITETSFSLEKHCVPRQMSNYSCRCAIIHSSLTLQIPTYSSFTSGKRSKKGETEFSSPPHSPFIELDYSRIKTLESTDNFPLHTLLMMFLRWQGVGVTFDKFFAYLSSHHSVTRN